MSRPSAHPALVVPRLSLIVNRRSRLATGTWKQVTHGKAALRLDIAQKYGKYPASRPGSGSVESSGSLRAIRPGAKRIPGSEKPAVRAPVLDLVAEGGYIDSGNEG